ncbi:MAG TPA: hypothetical protein PKW30_04135 [Campylobacterales bacterium]|nr:hypothetical protein [Campylobacterales bacterium]
MKYSFLRVLFLSVLMFGCSSGEKADWQSLQIIKEKIELKYKKSKMIGGGWYFNYVDIGNDGKTIYVFYEVPYDNAQRIKNRMKDDYLIGSRAAKAVCNDFSGPYIWELNPNVEISVSLMSGSDVFASGTCVKELRTK